MASDKAEFVDRVTAGGPGTVLRCTCLAKITMDALQRGYCRNCTRPLEVRVGAVHFGLGHPGEQPSLVDGEVPDPSEVMA